MQWLEAAYELVRGERYLYTGGTYKCSDEAAKEIRGDVIGMTLNHQVVVNYPFFK